MRKTVIAAALVGYVGWLNYQNRKTLETTTEANKEQQITNRFKQAIGQLYCNWGMFLTPPPSTDASPYSGCIIRASPDPDVDVIAYDTGALIGSCLTGS